MEDVALNFEEMLNVEKTSVFENKPDREIRNRYLDLETEIVESGLLLSRYFSERRIWKQRSSNLNWTKKHEQNHKHAQAIFFFKGKSDMVVLKFSCLKRRW